MASAAGAATLAAPPPQPAEGLRQQDAAALSSAGAAGEAARPLGLSGSMEDVWKDILSTHHSTLDFATYATCRSVTLERLPAQE